MPNNLPSTRAPQWKARYRSTVLDLDSALLTDPDARKAALSGNETHLASMASLGLIDFSPDIKKLAEATRQGGTCVSVVSRFSDALVKGILNDVCGEGNVQRYGSNITDSKKFGEYLAWVDKDEKVAASDHVALVGHTESFAKLAETIGYGVDAAFGIYHAEGAEYYTEAQYAQCTPYASRIL